MGDIKGLREINQKIAEAQLSESRHNDRLNSDNQLQQTIVRSFKSLVDYLDSSVSKTAVVNQLKEVGTPDALEVARAVEKLHVTITEQAKSDKTEENLNKIATTISQVLEEAKKIPKSTPDAPEQQFVDYTDQMKSLGSALDSIETTIKNQNLTVEAPIVNVPQVEVQAPDLTPLDKGLKSIETAVKKIVIPKTIIDNSKIEKELKTHSKLLKEIVEKPTSSGSSGHRITPYEDNQGVPAFITLDNGAIPTTGGDPSSSYGFYQETTSGTKTYYGFTDADANWLIKEEDSSTETFKWATITNNVSEPTYAGAWTNRATLTYGRKDEAF